MPALASRSSYCRTDRMEQSGAGSQTPPNRGGTGSHVRPLCSLQIGKLCQSTQGRREFVIRVSASVESRPCPSYLPETCELNWQSSLVSAKMRSAGSGGLSGAARSRKQSQTKPIDLSALFMSSMSRKFRKQSQMSYHPCFHLITVILGPLFGKNECTDQ
jgi:hypothetical protein